MTNTFTNINGYLRKIPSALAGLALAIASLGLCWESVANLHLKGVGQLSGAIIAGCILVPLFFKFMFNPHLLVQDLQHPVAGSVIPTMTMATMVIANSIALYHFQLGLLFSFLATILHLYFLGAFIFYRSKGFKFKQILPGWFVPPIGLLIVLMMHPGGVNPVFSEFLLKFGLFSYALLLPLVLYRLLFSEKLAPGEKPTLVILAAPASLLLAGYFAVVTQPSYLMVAILFFLALLMTLFVYAAFIKLLRLPFTPAYSAFTFPLVVGAIALFKTSNFLLKEDFDIKLVEITLQLANIELIIATMMVGYVSYRYVLYFCQLKNAQ
ncbi:MAG: TDT family transporter [Psychromonas sp.]